MSSGGIRISRILLNGISLQVGCNGKVICINRYNRKGTTPMIPSPKQNATYKEKHMSKSIYHIHHIIPRHAGGTDDPSNLVKLTVAEHAEAHRKLFEEHGNQYDYLAWKGLAGEIGREEILYEVRKENFRKGNIVANKNGAYKKGNAAFLEKLKDPVFKAKWIQAQKDAGVGELGVWGKWNKGKTRSDEAKANYSTAALKRERVPCIHCGIGYTKPNIKKHEKACETK